MLHLHFLITRKDGLSRQAFSDHWRTSTLPWPAPFPASAATSRTTPRRLSAETRPPRALSKSGLDDAAAPRRPLTARLSHRRVCGRTQLRQPQAGHPSPHPRPCHAGRGSNRQGRRSRQTRLLHQAQTRMSPEEFSRYWRRYTVRWPWTCPHASLRTVATSSRRRMTRASRPTTGWPRYGLRPWPICTTP